MMRQDRGEERYRAIAIGLSAPDLTNRDFVPYGQGRLSWIAGPEAPSSRLAQEPLWRFWLNPPVGGFAPQFPALGGNAR